MSTPSGADSPAPRHLKLVPIISMVLGVVVIAGSAGLGGYYYGQRSPVADAGAPVEGADLTAFWKAWRVLDEKYYGEADITARIDGAISGLVSSAKDPYTVYLEPKKDKQFRDDLEGSFGGIGAELLVKNGLLTVTSALADTPAERAGLKPEDVIVKIGDKKTADLTFTDAIDSIRGEKGTSVTLTIARKTEEKPFEVVIVRDTIVVKSVTTDTLDGLAYIKVNQFGQDTSAAFTTALQEAKNSGKKGVIVDLRNNPGGFLNVAVQMIGSVLPKESTSDKQALKDRVAVLERGKENEEEQLKATNGPIADTIPMVVLVNGGSASASEIFAGAMKDYGRAKVVGVKTYGKGSVQDLLELGNGGSIKVTIAKWFTPLGTGIDGTGIEPDVVVELPEDATASKNDAQVTKAIELLK